MTSLNYDRKLIARHNPRLAYILECLRVPLAPVMYPVQVTFNTAGQPTQPQAGRLPRPMSSDMWITALEYTVRCATAFAGSPLKPQYDQGIKLNPYIDVFMRFEGAPSLNENNRITTVPMPLETVAKAAGNPDPYNSAVGNWHVIQKDQDLLVDFYMHRTLGANEVPYEVTLAVKGYQIDGCCLSDIRLGDAKSCLLKMGLLQAEDTTATNKRA
jgi:hypothetical protein